MVFCATDLLAQGAIRVILQRGLRIPDDIAVVGFDEGRYSTPTLTTISPDKRQIAETAVARLLRRSEEPAVPMRDTVTRFRLIERESTRGTGA